MQSTSEFTLEFRCNGLVALQMRMERTKNLFEKEKGELQDICCHPEVVEMESTELMPEQRICTTCTLAEVFVPYDKLESSVVSRRFRADERKTFEKFRRFMYPHERAKLLSELQPA